ncbi:aldehyde dehydrogenase family protein [Patulibacter minatonensis]|uniref:aldehyde dehydrogenase family protein n=1 Tax=Patulibacter minatonensis TaxID=298163 RepID=UPI00047B5EAC|nr:aldehyde dehydrogenase family protein [Patulibacter minatonensis]
MSTTDLTTPDLLIDGAAVGTDDRLDVLNPATGAVVGTSPVCTRGQLDDAFAAAERAAPPWRGSLDERRAALGAAAAALAGAVDEIAPLLVAEQGKPMREARLEVKAAAYWLGYYAGTDLARETLRDDAKAFVEVRRRPAGVVAAITPWNFPLLLACWKIGPALAAGCTMVLKPSPYTPLSTLRMGEVLDGVLPDGVLNVVAGRDELGAWMTGHPAVRKITFTGSVATGKRVMSAAADDLKRVTLELGGNDAAILLDDVDPGAIAKQLFWSAFLNAGQLCCAVKRVYVPSGLRGELVDALTAEAERVVVGDGAVRETTMGPLNNRPQLDHVRAVVDEAVRAGARSTNAGAALPDGGHFFAPTILDGADDAMRVVADEQFGPALPVIAYDDVEDALARANAGTFGLSGSVWGQDEDRAADLAERLECGTAWVNTHYANDPGQPFGGLKWSGVGVENGRWGVETFTDLQVVHRARG